MDQAEPEIAEPKESFDSTQEPIAAPSLTSSVVTIYRPPHKPKPSGYPRYTSPLEVYTQPFQPLCIPNEKEMRADDEIIITAELARKALDQRIPVKEALILSQAEDEKLAIKKVQEKHETLGWGWGGEGVAGTLKFGELKTPNPMYSMGSKKFIDIAAGRKHTLLVEEQGTVFACGENKKGVLGNTSKKLGLSKQFKQRQDMLRKRPMKWFPSATLPSGHNKGGCDFKISQVAVTDSTSFAREVAPSEGEQSIEALIAMINQVDKLIENNGGSSFEGNFGLLELRAHLVEQRAAIHRKFVGTVLVWGEGKNGQLGLGRYDKHKEPLVLVENPTPLPGLLGKGVRYLAAGCNHVLALTQHGTVYSWGMGRDGRLGHGDYEDRWEPTLIEKLARKKMVVTVIGAGHAHSLAVGGAGKRVLCWGRGAHGRLGTGRHLNKNVPTEMTHNFPESFEEKGYSIVKAALGGAHTIVLCERSVEPRLTNPWGIETRIYAWGFGRHGQLGTDLIVHIPTPYKVKMPKWERVVDISAGKSHSCAVTVYGQLYTWGKGWFGVLGQGDDQLRIAPTLLETTKNMILKVSAGLMHTTALSLRRGGLSRRAVDKADPELTMRGTPPVYLGLPKQSAMATGFWKNARCLSSRPIEAGKEGDGEEEEDTESEVEVEVEEAPTSLLLGLLDGAVSDDEGDGDGGGGGLQSLLGGVADSAPTPKNTKSGDNLESFLGDAAGPETPNNKPGANLQSLLGDAAGPEPHGANLQSLLGDAAGPSPSPSAPTTPKPKSKETPKVVFGSEDPKGVSRAAWGDEEKKSESPENEAKPPLTLPQEEVIVVKSEEEEKKVDETKTPPESPSKKKQLKHRERTWRDLTPDEWYRRSNKTEVFYTCEAAKFTCLSFHCARQCMNGQHLNRTRLLKRAEARLENSERVKENIRELREEGHTEGDVKRFIKQFARREDKKMKEIDMKWGMKHKEVKVSDAPLSQISQCSLTDSCRLLQCIPEFDHLKIWNAAAVHIQRISRGGRGRRRAIDKKASILEMRNTAATNALQLNVMNKIEKNAKDHKVHEIRKQARITLSVADHDSAQFRWYAKLQVVLQFIEEQKMALAIMFSSAGVKDPHPVFEDNIFEPCCRTLQELREKQRRHPQTQRLNNTQLVKLVKAHDLPLYGSDLNDDNGEHQFHIMAVFGRLVNVQNETNNYFEFCEDINKDIDLCNKDDALWDDPAHRAKWTAQEITRNKKRIKEERDALETELRGRQQERQLSKKRRASLSRIEQLSSMVKMTRGRQRLRMIARRRTSLNLREARVRKDIEEFDREFIRKGNEAKEGVAESLNACSLLAFPKKDDDPFSLKTLTDEQVLHTRQGNKNYEKFIGCRCEACRKMSGKSGSVGNMDIDTYSIKESKARRRGASICAPERYRASTVQFAYSIDRIVDPDTDPPTKHTEKISGRLFDFENIWALAKEKKFPPIHSTSWFDEPLSKRSVRPAIGIDETGKSIQLWSRDKWEEESRMIDLIAGKNDVHLICVPLQKEMDELRLAMYPPEEEYDDDEEGEWEEGEEGDWDEEDWEEGDWDEEDWEEGDEEYGEEGEEEYGEEEGGNVAVVEQGSSIATGLAEGWVESWDEGGNVYYYNEVTGESSWEFPSAESVGGGGGGGWDGWQTLVDESGRTYYFNPATGESEWA